LAGDFSRVRVPKRYKRRVRIISGEWRGRKLKAPEGLVTRPMLGRVREALFSTLGDEVREARVLDLFAGTGSLGFESLSRGADHVRFVERDRRVGAVLTENLETLGAKDRAQLRMGDALSPRMWEGEQWSLIFLDPPYPMLREGDGRQKVLSATGRLLNEFLAPGGLVLLHTEPRSISEHDFARDVAVRRRDYGRTVLWYLRLAEAGAEAEADADEVLPEGDSDDPGGDDWE